MPNNKSYKVNATIMSNDNGKGAMTQAFSCEDCPRSLKDQGFF